jgi:DnaK suppressor protein
MNDLMMSEAARRRFTTLLTDQRRDAQQQIAALTRSFEDIVSAVEATNNDDEHDPEGTTIAFERAQVSALLNQAKADLEAIDSAATRLDIGTYGLCEMCGNSIGEARLEAIPAATHCVRCA